MLCRALVLMACALFICANPGAAQVREAIPQGQTLIPDAARPTSDFDVERATRAYLDSIPAEQRAKSDAYFEGGYWLQLIGLLYGLGVAAILLFGRVSARMRDRVERITRQPWLQTMLYAAAWIALTALMTLPLSLYQGWFRELQYGLSNLSLPGWFGEQAKSLLIGMIFGSVVIAIIYAFVRRRGGNWWLSASVVSVLFVLFVQFVGPVFVAPVFNDYKPLGAGPVRDATLALARANGVPANEVFWFDASKQTTRISANVSGLFSTMRISLNDNLLGKTSVPEINAAMAHELAHYVLNHGFKFTLQLGLLLTVGFALTQWAQGRLLSLYGDRWRVRGAADIAGLPLVAALLSIWFFLMTPLTNSIVRTAEKEADLFGLNAAREPHGFASVAMRLSTYRKLDPSPLEEMLFFDHPSGRSRVAMAMRWFKEHPDAGVAGMSAPSR
jgi:STE24 endopeptidase